ncbi:MAG: S8 family serine peptidase [Bacteroidia bacterium]
MLFRAVVFLFIVFIAQAAKADKYYIYFADKAGQTLDPYEYFNTKAIERRVKCRVPLVQKSDLPVNPNYISRIEELSDSLSVVSRWLNMVCVYANHNGIEEIRKLPFVDLVEKAKSRCLLLSNSDSINALGDDEKLSLAYQLNSLGYQEYKARNYTGSGVTIAVFDAGFTKANEHVGLAHLNVLSSYDFVQKDNNPFHGSTHGTSVLGNIGGRYNEQPIGMAQNANYLLARTERHFLEMASEEENWLAAAEWADKNGADIISSSLGYTNTRYFREDMNGTSLVAKAAMLAFSKGIIVVNSAGNEGDNEWKYIGTPADADSVLAVGGVSPKTGLRIDFSSYGPNAKGQLKPNVTACAKTFTCSPSGYEIAYGTSFSAPLVAGFIACAIEAKPNLNHKQLFELIQQSSHLYPYSDYSHGYGIPQAKAIFGQMDSIKYEYKIESFGKNSFHIIPKDSSKVNKDSFCTYFKEVRIHTKIETISGKTLYYSAANPWFDWRENINSWPRANIYTSIQHVEPDKKYVITVFAKGFQAKKEFTWQSNDYYFSSPSE